MISIPWSALADRESLRGELVSLPGQALAAQTLSIKGREERIEGDGSDVLICAFTPDHGEESLPLPGVRRRKLAPTVYIDLKQSDSVATFKTIK